MRDFSYPDPFEPDDFLTASHPGTWFVHETAEKQNSFAPGFDDVDGLWRSGADVREFVETSLGPEDPARLTFRFAADEVPLSRHRHRKVRGETVRKKPPLGERLSLVIVASTVALMAGVAVLGATVAHEPLRHLAGKGTPHGLTAWWPLLVYGPWLAASLSVLHAALYQRRALHSWYVVLLFSAFAIVFCVAQAPRTIISATAASLPTIATVSVFHQLVRQITLTRPPRRGGANRRTPAA